MKIYISALISALVFTFTVAAAGPSVWSVDSRADVLKRRRPRRLDRRQRHDHAGTES